MSSVENPYCRKIIQVFIHTRERLIINYVRWREKIIVERDPNAAIFLGNYGQRKRPRRVRMLDQPVAR